MAETQRLEIKKYPNRRFYDVTRSRHVTLNDLHELVQAGNEIVVTDTATGADITNIVLAQIILEHDPPKMDLFPASLLHQAIQANQQMVRKFVDEYFTQAVSAFADSRKQFDAYLRRSGFSALTPSAPMDWVRMLFPGMSQTPRATSSEQSNAPSGEPRPTGEDIHTLREQMAELKQELETLRKAGSKVKPKQPRRKRKP